MHSWIAIGFTPLVTTSHSSKSTRSYAELRWVSMSPPRERAWIDNLSCSITSWISLRDPPFIMTSNWDQVRSCLFPNSRNTIFDETKELSMYSPEDDDKQKPLHVFLRKHCIEMFYEDEGSYQPWSRWGNGGNSGNENTPVYLGSRSFPSGKMSFNAGLEMNVKEQTLHY